MLGCSWLHIKYFGNGSWPQRTQSSQKKKSENLAPRRKDAKEKTVSELSVLAPWREEHSNPRVFDFRTICTAAQTVARVIPLLIVPESAGQPQGVAPTIPIVFAYFAFFAANPPYPNLPP
jgi:hypothetical protein